MDVPGREGISPGVVVRTGNKSECVMWCDVDVSAGRRVEESVLSPVGVSSAVTYTSASRPSAITHQFAKLPEDISYDFTQ